MQNGMKAPRPAFLDKLTNDEVRELASYLKDHDNEFVSAMDGGYRAIGYVVEPAVYRFLIAGTRYTEKR